MHKWGFLSGPVVKNPPVSAEDMSLISGPGSCKEPACQCRRYKRCRFDPWVWKILWRRAWELTPVFMPGESHEQVSLAGYSPWGHTELDTTEETAHTCTHTRKIPYAMEKLNLCTTTRESPRAAPKTRYSQK